MPTGERDHSLRPPVDVNPLQHVYPEAFDSVVRLAQVIPGDLFDDMVSPAELDDTANAPRDLLEKCDAGFHQLYPNVATAIVDVYRDAIATEMKEIEAAGLQGTFVFAHRVIDALRREKLPLGPATGIGLQSVTAFLLGITSYDPVQVNVGFRPMFDCDSGVSPMIDLQIPPSRRDDAARIVSAVAGKGKAAYAPAIERITPARAVRMVARITPAAEHDVDEALQIISHHPGESIEAMWREDRALGRLYRRSPEVAELLRRASLLEHLPSGVIRSRRTMAVGGVALTDFLGTSPGDTLDDTFVHTNRDALPTAALLRFDFTPIGAMTALDRVDHNIHRVSGTTYRYEHMAIRDLGVWEDIQRGDTLGVFLFEGQTLQDQRAGVPLETIDDLANFLAVMRAHTDSRTVAERVMTLKTAAEQPHSTAGIAAVLKKTRGHILYDEQLRDIIQVLTGGESHASFCILRALQAADPATLASVRGSFMRAMADNDIELGDAEYWFDRCLYFAKKTQSRERVIADALIVCKLFLLKRYHAAEFYAALLEAYHHNDGRQKRYLLELKERNMLLGVDINASERGYAAVGVKVRRGFDDITGVDEMNAERIVHMRGRRGYHSLEDFVRRVGNRHVSKEAVKQLIEAGAFDSLETPRGQLTKALDKLYRSRTKAAKAVDEGQLEFPFE